MALLRGSEPVLLGSILGRAKYTPGSRAKTDVGFLRPNLLPFQFRNLKANPVGLGEEQCLCESIHLAKHVSV